jgi:virginiamycin B lyase
LQRHLPTSVSLALLVIILSSLFTFLYGDIQRLQPAPAPRQVHRVLLSELPEFLQHAQSKQINRVATRTNGWGIALDELRGFAWVAEPGCEMSPVCQSSFPATIGKYALSDGSLIANYKEPDGIGLSAYSSPLFIQVSPDGDIWFTEPTNDAIARFDPDDRRFQQWRTSPGSAPYDLVFDANGNLWFTEITGNSIGFFNTRTLRITETPLPTPDSLPYGITSDHQGHIWFAENRSDEGKIGTFTPTLSGQISLKEYSISNDLLTRPHLLTADMQNNIWISEGFSGNIARFSPTTGTVTQYPVALPCRRSNNCTHVSGIVADGQNRIWFTDSLNATIGYLLPTTGKVHARLIPDANAHPHDGLAVQSNGTLWFTEQYGEQGFGPALLMWPRGTVR